MSESESVRRRYREPGSSGTNIRWSRSEPSLSKSDNATSQIRKSEDAFLRQYAVPFSAWLLQVCTHILLTVAKVVASLLALLIVTCLMAAILPYTGLPSIADKLPKTTEFTKYLLRVIQNFSMGNVKKRHRLRVYQL